MSIAGDILILDKGRVIDKHQTLLVSLQMSTNIEHGDDERIVFTFKDRSRLTIMFN